MEDALVEALVVVVLGLRLDLVLVSPRLLLMVFLCTSTCSRQLAVVSSANLY